jgi:hypothetical protein
MHDPDAATKSFSPDGPKPLMERTEAECAWPLGDGPFFYCAAHKQPGWDYCENHVRIMYNWR